MRNITLVKYDNATDTEETFDVAFDLDIDKGTNTIAPQDVLIYSIKQDGKEIGVDQQTYDWMQEEILENI